MDAVNAIVARLAEGRTLCVNTNNSPATVTISGDESDLLRGAQHAGKIDLPPYGVALVQ